MLNAIDQYRTLRRQALTSAFLAREKGQASRRTTPRARLSLPISMQIDEWETDTYTCELSAGGCAFLLNSEPTQQLLNVSIEVARGLYMTGEARVVGVTPRGGRFYVCVSFVALSQAARTMLEDIVLNTLLTAEAPV